MKKDTSFTIGQVSRAWVAGAAVLVGFGALARNGVLFGMGVLLAAALGVAWLWARYSMRNLIIERRFSQTRAFFGETVDMTHRFTNAKPLPVPWLSVEDEYPGVLELITQAETMNSTKARVKQIRTSISLGWYERVIRHYAVRCIARGEHEFGPLTIQSGDVFGLFRRVEELPTPQTLIVYPRYVPLTSLGITARQPFGDFRAAQELAIDPLRIKTVREYSYGDNPRHIHWKATARRGSLQTKLFEPAATPQLHLFCNQDTFEHIWQGLDLQTLELTITVAASLAAHAIEQGYMVGLQVNAFSPGSDRHVRQPPSRDPAQLTRILESLARVTGWSGLSAEELIRAERSNISIGSTVVLVTGIVTDDMLNVLLALRRAGHPVTLVECSNLGRSVSSTAALHSQGITYYFVAGGGRPLEIEDISL